MRVLRALQLFEGTHGRKVLTAQDLLGLTNLVVSDLREEKARELGKRFLESIQLYVSQEGFTEEDAFKESARQIRAIIRAGRESKVKEDRREYYGSDVGDVLDLCNYVHKFKFT